jgi:hypothetical protein
MDQHSILAGKTYRTGDNELRRVLAVEGDLVTFNTVAAMPGVIARAEEVTLPLAEFARQAEGEASS